nr:hypothetical protein [Kofleriaceae bacterium]
MRSLLIVALAVTAGTSCQSGGSEGKAGGGESAPTTGHAAQQATTPPHALPPAAPLPPLVKDPGGATGNPAWGITMGGLGIDAPRGVAVAKDGSIVVVGYYDGDGGFGDLGKRPSHGGTDAFVAMLDPKGKIKWLQTFGGPRDDVANGVAISGNTIVVVGSFIDDLTVGSFHHAAAGADDAYAVAFDMTGEPLWMFTTGGIDTDGANTVAATADGGWIIGGSFKGTAVFGQTEFTAKGRTHKEDAFLLKLDKDVKVEWVKQFGGNYDDSIAHVAIDPQGNIIVQGQFADVSEWGGAPLKAGGGSDNDVVLAKYNANGEHLWSKRFGDAFNDVAGGVGVDPSGHITMTGSFDQTVSFGDGDRHTSKGESDIFVARFTPDGALEWAKTFGADREDIGWGIAVDDHGNSVTTGWFQSTVDFGAFKLTSKGNRDVFALKLDAAGEVVWARSWGDHDHDRGRAIALAPDGAAICAGTYGFTIDIVSPALESQRAPSDKIPKPDLYVIRLDR